MPQKTEHQQKYELTKGESLPATCLPDQPKAAPNQALAVMPTTNGHLVSLTWAASTTPAATYRVYRRMGGSISGGHQRP